MRAALHLPALLACWLLGAAVACAQDFVSPSPSGVPLVSPLASLERGLPLIPSGAGVEVAARRWFGLDALTTRALALAAGWRSFRSVLGISQTGDPELGWTSVGAAAGVTSRAAGAALRAVARRDRDPPAEPWAIAPGVGVEVGGGAIVRVSEDLAVWAQAPQLWTRGVAPPLLRPLEIGGGWRSGPMSGWLTRRAPALGGSRSERAAGIGWSGRGAVLWLEARDQPLRGSAGASARARLVAAAFLVESHPVLGETVSFSLAITKGTP